MSGFLNFGEIMIVRSIINRNYTHTHETALYLTKELLLGYKIALILQTSVLKNGL